MGSGIHHNRSEDCDNLVGFFGEWLDALARN